MSLFLRGVKMPIDCGKCFVGDRSICKDECPLVDIPVPHGNLIDRDELTVDVWEDDFGYYYDADAPVVIKAEYGGVGDV